MVFSLSDADDGCANRSPLLALRDGACCSFADLIAMTPIGRVGQVGEIAAAIDFLTSDQASFIAGHVLNVDGGTAM